MSSLAAGIAIAVVLFWALAVPIVNGMHLGYNGATDNACTTRLGLQWCGHVRTEAQTREGEAAEAAEKARIVEGQERLAREASSASPPTKCPPGEPTCP